MISINAKLHPLAKTAIEARRAIQRLDAFVESKPDDQHVKSGVVAEITEGLKQIRRYVPKDLLDVDLSK